MAQGPQLLLSHAIAHAAAARAAQLQSDLRAVGITVTEPEARTILADVLSKPDTTAKLKELEVACRAMLPSLEALNRAYATSQ